MIHWGQRDTPLNITINRPGVQGAIYLISSRYCLSQTVRAVDLKFLENVHPSKCVTCHMSGVIFLLYFLGQSGGVSWGRVGYQRGLPI